MAEIKLITFDMTRMQEQQEQDFKIRRLGFYQQIKCKYQVFQQNFKTPNEAIYVLQQGLQLHSNATKFWILLRINKEDLFFRLKLVDSFRNDNYLEHISAIKIVNKYNEKIQDSCMTWSFKEQNFQIQKSFQYEITPKQLISQLQVLKNRLKKLSQNLSTKQISQWLQQKNSQIAKKMNSIKRTIKRQIQIRTNPNFQNQNIQNLINDAQKQLYEKFREHVKNTKYQTQNYLLNGIEIFKNDNIEIQKKIQGTFTHITKCKVQYQILDSVHPQTDKLISNQQNRQSKRKQDIMVMKKKCQNNCSQKHKFNIQQNMRVFQDQVKICKMFRDQKHPFISPYFINKQGNCLFSKFQKMTLAEYKKQIHNKSLKEKIPIIPTVQKFLVIFSQISKALVFLSEQKKIIHRDLKPENILISKRENPNIMDFGSATTIHEPQTALHQKRIQCPYHSLLNNIIPTLREKYTQMQYQRHQLFDIYSLGKIIQECLLNFIEVSRGDKTGFVSILKDNIKYIVQRCMVKDPILRFTASQICYILNTMCKITFKIEQQMYKKVLCFDQTR